MHLQYRGLGFSDTLNCAFWPFLLFKIGNVIIECVWRLQEPIERVWLTSRIACISDESKTANFLQGPQHQCFGNDSPNSLSQTLHVTVAEDATFL
jgi:hypothetical protein